MAELSSAQLKTTAGDDIPDLESVTFLPRMTNSDAVFTKWDAHPVLRGPVGGVAVFDGTLDHDRFLHKQQLATRLIPRMTQIYVRPPATNAPPWWVDTPHFDIDYHCRFTTAPGDGSLDALLAWSRTFFETPLDPFRPPWEFLVVAGLEGNRWATLSKTHHAITDGVGGLVLAKSFFDFEAEPELEELPPERPRSYPSDLDLWKEAWSYDAGVAVDFVKRMGRRAKEFATDPADGRLRTANKLAALKRLGENAYDAPGSSLMAGRSPGFSLTYVEVPFAALKTGAKAVGGTFNDGFMAAVAGGVARYHERHGEQPPTVHGLMAINARTTETAAQAGNVLGGIQFDMPTDIGDPASRLHAIAEITREKRAEVDQGDVTSVFMALMTRFPGFVTRKMGDRLLNMDIATSNVPGLPIPVYLGGCRQLFQIPFGPRVGAAVNFTMATAGERAIVGINADPAAVPDLDVFRECMNEALEEIIKLA